MVEMLEEPLMVESNSWKSWKSTIAKILVVLLFPLAVGINFGGFYWASALLQIGSSTFTPFDTLLIVTISVLIMLPGIFFERRIRSKPIKDSIRKIAVASLLITWLVPLVPSFFFVPVIAMVVIFVPTFYIPLLSISFFIILPILDREFVIRHTPEQFRNRKYSQLSRDLKSYVGNSRYLYMIVWTGLLFSPIVSTGLWGDILIESVLYSVRIFAMDPWFGGWELMSLSISYTIVSTSLIHSAFLIFSLRFLFVRDLLRYNEGNVTRSRLISMGILSEIVPVTIMTLILYMASLTFGFPIGFYSLMLPTPIFPLLGYAYVRMSRNLSSAIILWDTEEHRMWFETDGTPSPEQQPKDMGIKVPIAYLIRSRLLKRMKR